MDELEIVQFRQLQGLNIFVNTVTYRSPHFHHEWELLWVLDAPLKVIWLQQEYILQPGDLALFPPRIPHEFQQISGICTFLCLQISSAGVSLPTNIMTQDILPRNYMTPEALWQIQTDVLEIAESYFKADNLYELRCFGKSALVLYGLLNAIPCRTISA